MSAVKRVRRIQLEDCMTYSILVLTLLLAVCAGFRPRYLYLFEVPLVAFSAACGWVLTRDSQARGLRPAKRVLVTVILVYVGVHLIILVSALCVALASVVLHGLIGG